MTVPAGHHRINIKVFNQANVPAGMWRERRCV
ncbi:hypothetical protein [Chitinophaga pinensis]